MTLDSKKQVKLLSKKSSLLNLFAIIMLTLLQKPRKNN